MPSPAELTGKTLNTNLSSLFALSQACGAHFLSRGAGNIINIASINTFIGGNRLAAYTASKAGVGGLTKALSNEWSGRNVRVNALAPGCVETDMWVAAVWEVLTGAAIRSTARIRSGTMTASRLSPVDGGGCPRTLRGRQCSSRRGRVRT